MTSFMESLARISLPNRGERGWLVMLECYLDDSGTHNDSRLIVWGGISGHHEFFRQFESAWKARLADPCDGRKPPLKKFHSYDLARSIGEFEDYNQAERDLTRRNFRKIITDYGLTWVSFGISKKAWEIIANDPIWGGHMTAEGMVFGSVIRTLCKSANDHGEPVSFQFDRGRSFPDQFTNIESAIIASKINSDQVSYGFSSVAENIGLQGADLVAHETYQYFSSYIDEPDSKPTLHLQQLANDAHDMLAGWYGEKEIRETLEAIYEDDTPS